MSWATQSSGSITTVSKSCSSTVNVSIASRTSRRLRGVGKTSTSRSPRPSSAAMKIGFGAPAANVVLPTPSVPSRKIRSGFLGAARVMLPMNILLASGRAFLGRC